MSASFIWFSHEVFANVLSFYQKTIKTILFKAEPMTDRTVHNSTETTILQKN